MKTFFTVLFVYVWLIVQVTSVTYSCDHSASCGCSRNDAILNKIVGGEAAIPSSWGWAVSLRDFTEEHICGGAIVSPKYIVTAAHCVSYPVNVALGMSVAVGMDRLNESKTVGQVRKVVQIIRHSSYDVGKYANDIAVLLLDSSLDLSLSASTTRLCVPQLNVANDVKSYPPDSSLLIAVGWGTLVFGVRTLPNQLQQVTVNAVPMNDDTCYPSIYYSELQFCAGVNGGGKDTCQGDSGGPLMRFESAQRRWVLAGITSYGTGCGSPLYAGVYTRVTTYTDWLKNIIGTDGLVEVEVDTSVVQSTSTVTTARITIDTTSRSMNNSSSMKVASYSVTFLFLLLTFHHFF